MIIISENSAILVVKKISLIPIRPLLIVWLYAVVCYEDRHPCFITRSHGSVTSVVRATREVNGTRQTYPLTTPTPLNRQSPNIAHVRDYVHNISPQATFGQDRPRGYVSPYSHSIFFISFFVRKIFSRT